MNPARSTGFFISGGTMPLDSESYVERTSDTALLNGLLAGSYCYVLNSRQMGKSSLSVRALSKLNQAGVRTALVDLTRVGGKNVTAAQWYAGLCDAIGQSLGLQREMLAYFRENSHLGPMQRFFGALEDVVLTTIAEPVVLFFDEIDSTKNLSFQADEFFAGIRECFNRRVLKESLKRLTFCLIGVAVPTDLISNPSTTPFNIGERIQLDDFTLSELHPLAEALGPAGDLLIQRIHYWTSGQPFLTQSLCEAVSADSSIKTVDAVDDLVRTRFLDRRARTTNTNLSDVGDRALNSSDSEANPERFRAELLSVYERAWRGGYVPNDESNRIAVILKLSGIMRSDGRRLVIRNRIYHQVFDRKWIEENMPERELLRERQAFRRGLFRAASASAFVIAIVCGLGLFAWKLGNDALSAKKMLDYELYVSDMNNMRMLEEIGDIARMDAILDRTKSSPYRGFEWSYWLSRIHDSPEEYTLDYSAPGKREEGLVSFDGKTICITDSLAGTATVVDRHTRRREFTAGVPRGARILSTRAGFLVMTFPQDWVEVRSLLSNQLIYTSKGRFSKAVWVITPTRCDFGVIATLDPQDGKPHDVAEVDWVTGSVRYRYHSSEMLVQIPLMISHDGRRLLATSPSPRDSKVKGPVWSVIDLPTQRKIDSFQTGLRTAFLDFSETGRLLLYRDPNYTVFCRDTVSHQNAYQREWDGGDIAVGAMITQDERKVLEFFGNGRATALDLATRQTISLGQHVWSLAPTESKSTVLAASTSVQLLPIPDNLKSNNTITGLRLARDDLGHISIFADNSSTVSHYTDPDLRLISHSPPPENLRDGYPYNGLWRMTVDPKKKVALFTDIDGKQKPTSISPVPVNYSCGSNRDSLVVLERGSHRIDAINDGTGKIRWSFQWDEGTIFGLWVAPKGDTVLALSGDVDLLAIDLKTGHLRSRLGGHNVRISNVSFTRDGRSFFTSGADSRVILWDMQSLKMIREFRGNAAQRPASADLSPDGRRVATCNFTGSWQLWDAQTGVQLMDIHGSALPLRSIIFSGDGKSLITAGDDLIVRRWSTLAQDPSVRIEVDRSTLKGVSR